MYDNAVLRPQLLQITDSAVQKAMMLSTFANGYDESGHASRLGRMSNQFGNDAIKRQANTKQIHCEKNCGTGTREPLPENSKYRTA
jgi:hypothetical protein